MRHYPFMNKNEPERLRIYDACLTFLLEAHTYRYGGSNSSEPSPVEFGLSWSWQQQTMDCPSLLEQLVTDALTWFEDTLSQMDEDPSDWKRECLRHRDVLRETIERSQHRNADAEELTRLIESIKHRYVTSDIAEISRIISDSGYQKVPDGCRVVPLKCPIGISIGSRMLCSAGYCIHCVSDRLMMEDGQC